MYLIIEKLIKDFIEIPRCEEHTLQDALKYIIEKDDSFDAAYYFSCNEFKNTISCYDFYPLINVNKNLITQINDHIERIELDLEEEPKEGEGLITYVAKKFVKKEYDNCFICIENVDQFKNDKAHKLNKYYLKEILTGFNSEYFLPVYIKDKQPDNTEKRILHAVLVLFSKRNKNAVTVDFLKNLSEFLSFFITMKTTKAADKLLNHFVNDLSSIINVDNIAEKNKKIFDVLKKLFADNGGEKNQRHSHLVYASLWSLNDNDPEDIFLEKERTFNFLENPPNQTESIPYIIDNKVLDAGKQHYFFEYMTEVYKQLNSGEEIKFSDFIIPKHLSSIKDQFNRFDEFIKTQKLNESDILVLVPIFPFGNNYENKDRLKYIGLLALYFDERSYSYFYNPNFLETISGKIFLSRYIVIQNMRRELRKKLISETGSIIQKEKEYYDKTSRILKDTIKCQECLIYLYEDDYTLKKVVDEEIRIPFPPKICIEDFRDTYPNYSNWLAKYEAFLRKIDDEISPFIYVKKDFIQNDQDSVYSLMLIPIQIPDRVIAGFILLINNTKEIIANKVEKSSFLYCHFDIASIAEGIISLFIQIFKQYKISDSVLSKLNHELPAQSEVIIQNAKSIHEELINQTINNKIHINNLVDRIFHAAHTIRIYSEYYKMKGFDEITMNTAKEELNLKIFCASLRDIFRANAKKRGINIKVIFSDDSQYENTIYVHQLFQLAIINLVNNAVQYASLGTSVIIKMISAGEHYKIIVENMGIAISKEDESKIFNENFRGQKASKKYLTGTGLGLFLVKKIVEAHEGNVSAKADNDIFEYNIFAIMELKRILKEYISVEEKMNWLNAITTNGKEDYETNFRYIPKEIFGLFRHYKDFQLRNTELIKEFIADRKKNNILFEELAVNYLKDPVSHIKFTVSINKQIT